MRFFTLWKYWKKPYNLRDFTLVAIDVYCELSGGGRIVLFNVGFCW